VTWREQAVTVRVPSAGLVLEAVWQAGPAPDERPGGAGGFRGAVVAPPHPEYGGSLDNPVVNEVAYALYRERLASLRFNWRGVGASQGVVTSELPAAEADYAAALDHLHETVGGPLLAAGYSFGAATALRVGLRDPRVRGLLLVAPPVAMIEALPLEKFHGPLHIVVGAEDRFAPTGPLSELIAPLPNGRLEVIPKADHFFAASGLAELHEAVRALVL
jgi:alpha/beta superfamily hydrolase